MSACLVFPPPGTVYVRRNDSGRCSAMQACVSGLGFVPRHSRVCGTGDNDACINGVFCGVECMLEMFFANAETLAWGGASCGEDHVLGECPDPDFDFVFL